MRGWLPSILLIMVALAGCTSPDPAPTVADPETETADEEEAPEMIDVDTDTSVPAPETIAVGTVFDGRLEHGFRVCRPSTGTCNEARPIADDQETFIDVPAGTMIAGNATLSWDPATALTEEMRLTVWWVAADQDADLHFLGGTVASGLIHAEFELPLELDGGQIWAYARAPYANQNGDIYIQNDFEQDFTIEVNALVQPAEPES